MNIRQVIILAAIFAFALPSLGAWDTRFFPTPDSNVRAREGDAVVFAQDVIVTQMIAAVNERWWVVYEEAWPEAEQLLDDQWRLLRSPEGVLATCKAAALELCSAVYIDGYLYQPGFLDTTRTKGPDELVYWSQTNILLIAGLPTNFFESTPVRNLMEHPRPTNEHWVASAGYGWDGLYKVLNLMTHTYKAGGALKVANEEWCDTGYSRRVNTNWVYQSGAFSYEAAWSSLGGANAENTCDVQYNAAYGNAEVVRWAVRLFTNSIADDPAFPAYLLNNSVAEAWQGAGGSFDINPGPDWYDPFNERNLDCGGGGQVPNPNQAAFDLYSAICNTGNVAYLKEGEATVPMSFGGYRLLIGEDEVRPSLGACDPSTILGAMTCTFSALDGPDQEQSICPFSGEDEDTAYRCDNIKEASITGIVAFGYIIDWGFYQK